MERLFKIRAHGSTVRREIFGGKAKEVPVLLYIISLLFILKYILGSLL